MILLAKAGLSAPEVSQMCHAELTAWADDVLDSLGVKREVEGKVIVSQRRPRPQSK